MSSQTKTAEMFSTIFRELGDTLSKSDYFPVSSDAVPDVNRLTQTLADAQKVPLDVSNIGLPDIAAEILQGVKDTIPEITANNDAGDQLQDIGRYLASAYDGLRNNSNDETWKAINGLINWWQESFPTLPLPHSADLLRQAVLPQPDSDEENTDAGGESETEPAGTKEKTENFWLIKLDYRDWDKSFKAGETRVSFTVYEDWKKRKRRPGYRLFSQLKIGEQVIGYGFGDTEGIMCLLQVVETAHIDPDHGEIVGLDLVSRVKPLIPLSAFDGRYHFTNEFQSSPGKRLFKLKRKEYEALLAPLPRPARTYLAGLSNDHIDGRALHDSLRFTGDVASIAAVIAYEKVVPPIAVALMGNWGSGKSFFMKMLRKNIESLGSEAGGTYCKSVAHIEFNSWHYSDANLWASITAKLFEGLDDFVAEKDTSGTPASLDTLLKKLDSATAFKAEQQKALDIAKAKTTDLQQDKNKLDKKVETARATLEGLSFPDMLHTLLSKEEVTSELKTIADNTQIPGLKKAPNIEAAKNALEDDAQRTRSFLEMIYAVQNPSLWIALALAAIIIYGGALLAGGLAWITKGHNLLISGVITGISPLLTRYQKVSANFKKADNWIRKQYGEIQTKAAAQYTTQMQGIQSQLTQSQQQTEALEKLISDAKANEGALRLEIDDQVTGKKLGEFIKGRATDERYTGSLGMISWIRRDFEQLDRYLLEMARDAKAAEMAPKHEAGLSDKKRIVIDRIVLYIDDLDRCRGEVVTRVLEAIHLLLAFPMFVVVVGVDPRWMHGALDVSYTGLLGTGEDGLAATSYDYLEKIFQVPFAIAAADDSGRKQLIRDQLNADTSDEPENGKDAENQNAGDTGPGDKHLPDQSVTAEADEKPAADREMLGKVAQSRPAAGQDQPAVIAPQRLKITPAELDFMQAISFLTGDSPRTIKRFINIYRIVRAHEAFAFEGEKEQDDYFAAMLLTGLMTGQNAEAALFFQMVATAAATVTNKEHKSVVHTFDEFLNGYMKNNKDLRPPAMQHLHAVMNADPQLKKLSTISMTVFKANLPLISRFSFRPLLLVLKPGY